MHNQPIGHTSDFFANPLATESNAQSGHTDFMKESFVAANIGAVLFDLTDAVEELSFGHEERVESEKTLDELELSKADIEEIPDIATIEALLKTLEDESAANDVASFSQRLIDVAASRLSILATVRGKTGDPTKQYLALAHALQTAEAQGQPPHVVEALRDAMDRVAGQYGQVIRADINTIEHAAAFSEERPLTDLFRATYRDAVLGQATFAGTLTMMLERFGDEIERGVELLRKALGADLAAVRPSSEPERLRAILQDLAHMTTAVSVLQRCRTIVTWLQRAFPTLDLKPLILMTDLVKLTGEQWIMSYHVLQLVQKYRLDKLDAEMQDAWDKDAKDSSHDSEDDTDDEYEDDEPKAQISFLNGLLDILRALPGKVFSNDEQRQQAVAAVQQLLDGLLITESR